LEALKAVTEIDGAELVRRARAGDGAAWEDIVSNFSRRIFNLAYRFTSSVDGAEDLTQDVFIRVYRSLDQYDPKQGDLANWLMRLARNLIIDDYRHRQRNPQNTMADAVADPDVDAILVQLPLPDHIDEARVIRALEPAKDVDGFHPFNAGQLYLGRRTLVPATPLGVMAMLREHQIELQGARAVVIGRSDIVGKPMAHLLLQANATVTICHSRTKDIARETLAADVLVAAVGVPGMVTPDMVKPGGVVIDVGINRTEAGIVGDVDPGAAEVAGYMTPVPGGVGPMTIACLLQNAVVCARYRRGDIVYPS